jgi:calcium-dependent protein kinase
MQSNLKEKMKTYAGTPLFMAPEINSRNYTFKVDLWAIGVVLVILVSGTHPFS